MESGAIRVSVRLSAKDNDILLLLTECRLKKLTLQAVRYYLGLTDATLVLPEYSSVEPRYASCVIRQDDGQQEYDLLKSMPPGNRSTAVKMMIRYAMEWCDIRHLLPKNLRGTSSRKQTARARPDITAAETVEEPHNEITESTTSSLPPPPEPVGEKSSEFDFI